MSYAANISVKPTPISPGGLAGGIAGGVGTTMPTIWYMAGTDAISGATANTVTYAGYITDAVARGMRVGDLVLYRLAAAPVSGTPASVTMFQVHTLTATAATLSVGTAIASASIGA